MDDIIVSETFDVGKWRRTVDLVVNNNLNCTSLNLDVVSTTLLK